MAGAGRRWLHLWLPPMGEVLKPSAPCHRPPPLRSCPRSLAPGRSGCGAPCSGTCAAVGGAPGPGLRPRPPLKGVKARAPAAHAPALVPPPPPVRGRAPSAPCSRTAGAGQALRARTPHGRQPQTQPPAATASHRSFLPPAVIRWTCRSLLMLLEGHAASYPPQRSPAAQVVRCLRGLLPRRGERHILRHMERHRGQHRERHREQHRERHNGSPMYKGFAGHLRHRERHR